jgi:hypothetical protein
MLPIHSRGELPRIFLIEGIANDDLPGSIRSALLEVVTIGYSIIIMAATTGSFGTVRNFTLDGEVTPIESLQGNLFVRRVLRGNRSRIEQREKDDYRDSQKECSKSFQNGFPQVIVSETRHCEHLMTI